MAQKRKSKTARKKDVGGEAGDSLIECAGEFASVDEPEFDYVAQRLALPCIHIIFEKEKMRRQAPQRFRMTADSLKSSSGFGTFSKPTPCLASVLWVQTRVVLKAINSVRASPLPVVQLILVPVEGT